MNRRGSIAFFLLLLVPGSLVLADTVICYVDMEKGQIRIETLVDENSKIQSEIETLTQRNTELKQNIEDWEVELSEVRPIIERVRRKKNSLYVILEKIVDENLREKATATYNRSTDILNRLRKTKEEMEVSIKNALIEMTENKTQIECNKRRMNWNALEVSALNGSIALTQNQVASLEAIVDNVDSINEEAAKYLER